VALNDCGIKTDSAGNLVIRNSASGNGTMNDYDLKTGTIVGTIERDFVDGRIGLVSPWANFSF
jgi:hypothetical protein